MIWDFVSGQQAGNGKSIMKTRGFSLDWAEEKSSRWMKTSSKSFIRPLNNFTKTGLIYRAKRLVNYCTFRRRPSFSDLEVVYEERQNPLYYIKYGPLVLATTRPETKFGDTAVGGRSR